MTAAPDIEALANSLRNCVMGGGGQGETAGPQIREAVVEWRLSVEKAGEEEGAMVELNSDVALPCHWEQCLDLMTGKVYFINLNNGEKTTEDPRICATSRSAIYFSSADDDSSDDSYIEEEDDNDGDVEYCSSSGVGSDYEDFYGLSCSDSSSSSCGSGSPSDSDSRRSVTPPCHILVAAGCKSCFMYFMVPKGVDACPRCGGALLHVGRNGYF
ncbi:hypothetical protein AXF42_Ash002201 [Apostasia shenzhenica]|uniref:WW domain-containing protein n=1 Tax=Apostasia shenzhenica TaxID=1088818 RepID=A0A2I0AMV0_9ASPA|nr:hypothetical protein AXF42_Ash002201 [Apostasia shenzhenica]